MKFVVFAIALLSASAAATASFPVPSSCSGTPNEHPLITQEPKQVATITNGVKFVVDEVDPPLLIVHVKGTPYEMGKAYGQLLKTEINELVPSLMKYIDGQIDQYLKFLPASWRAAIEKWGINFALNITYDLTKPYISEAFTAEVQGVADGSGLTFDQIMHVALFPELIQAACSMFGAWGPATQNSRGGKLVQLRALDWGTDGPFQRFPLVAVYHPEATNGYPFATVSWAGLVGSLTGYSSQQVGICEKVWLGYKGSKPRNGIPWTFLLRDILQYDTSVDEAVTRIQNANRTCSIFVGVGDGKAPTFRGIEYSHDELNVYDDADFPAYPPYHNLSKGLVFFDKHVQPSHDTCLNDLLANYYGNIEPVTTLRNITAQFQTGDMHAAIYDPSESMMYVVNAGVADANGTAVPAYDRPWVRLDMSKAWDVEV